MDKDRAAVEAILREYWNQPRLNGSKYHKRWTGRELLKIIRAKGIHVDDHEYWRLLQSIREGND